VSIHLTAERLNVKRFHLLSTYAPRDAPGGILSVQEMHHPANTEESSHKTAQTVQTVP
jgi:hypothetical protein